jgi:hypothetical protein
MAKISYDIGMAKAVRQLKQPVKGLKMDVVARPNYLALTVYESNIMEYNDGQRADIMEYLLLVRQLIQSYGTPCEIEGVKYDSERKRKR